MAVNVNDVVYIYNYLTNLWGLFYKENIGNNEITWGFNDPLDQSCVVHPNATDILSLLEKRFTLRSEILLSDLSQLPAQNYALQSAKTVSYFIRGEKKRDIGKNAALHLAICERAELDGFMNGVFEKYLEKIGIVYDLDGLFTLIRDGLFSFDLLFGEDAKLPVGALLSMNLKKAFVVELFIDQEGAAFPMDITVQIDALCKRKKIKNKDIYVIADERSAGSKLDPRSFSKVSGIYRLTNVREELLPPRVPVCVKSAVLKEQKEYLQKIEDTNLLGLPVHNDLPKNWDTFLAFSQLVNERSISKGSCILDAGGEYYSILLQQLKLFGYENLHCVNLVFPETRIINGINYHPGDITKMNFKANSFGGVACLSVLEHGVDLNEFFEEMYRILVKNGILLISVDYWPTPIDTKGKKAYGNDVMVFNRGDILNLENIAASKGFKLITPIPLNSKNKVVESGGLRYTFLYFSFVKC